MPRAYKLVAPPQDSKVQFGLLFIGNFKEQNSFKKMLAGRCQDGNFCLIAKEYRYFVTVKDGEIIEEEMRDAGASRKSGTEGVSTDSASGANEGEQSTTDKANPS